MRLIEPFGAGGGPDVISRAVSPKLSALWGPARDSREPSRRGKYSGPRFGREVATRRLHIAREHQRSRLQRRGPEESAYNPLKDFIPVVPLTSQPYVLVAGKASGI